jgi:hypothetical protein
MVSYLTKEEDDRMTLLSYVGLLALGGAAILVVIRQPGWRE